MLIESVQFRHLVMANPETEYVGIFLQVFFAIRFGQRNSAQLKIPADEELGRRLSIYICEVAKGLILKAFGTSERTISLNDDVIFLAKIEHVPAIAERSPFDLIHDGQLACSPCKRPDLFDCVIAHANVLGQTISFRLN